MQARPGGPGARATAVVALALAGLLGLAACTGEGSGGPPEEQTDDPASEEPTGDAEDEEDGDAGESDDQVDQVDGDDGAGDDAGEGSAVVHEIDLPPPDVDEQREPDRVLAEFDWGEGPDELGLFVDENGPDRGPCCVAAAEEIIAVGDKQNERVLILDREGEIRERLDAPWRFQRIVVVDESVIVLGLYHPDAGEQQWRAAAINITDGTTEELSDELGEVLGAVAAGDGEVGYVLDEGWRDLRTQEPISGWPLDGGRHLRLEGFGMASGDPTVTVRSAEGDEVSWEFVLAASEQMSVEWAGWTERGLVAVVAWVDFEREDYSWRALTLDDDGLSGDVPFEEPHGEEPTIETFGGAFYLDGTGLLQLRADQDGARLVVYDLDAD